MLRLTFSSLRYRSNGNVFHLNRAILNISQRKYMHSNLLITLDAFGTIYEPHPSVPQQYAEVAEKHGLSGLNSDDVAASFKKAFKAQLKSHPNYGKSTGMDAERWWTEIITNTFKPHLSTNQTFPEHLARDLLHRFSSREGYKLYPDVFPFLGAIQAAKLAKSRPNAKQSSPSGETDPIPQSRYTSPILGIISNSDDRVVSVLESFGVTIDDLINGGVDATKGESDTTGAQKRNKAKGMIDFVALSYNVGYQKPEKEIFQAVKEHAGITDNEGDWLWYHLGDDLREDVRGAEDAGGKGILLDRSIDGWKTRKISIDGVGWDDEVLIAGSLLDVLDIVQATPTSVPPSTSRPVSIHFV